MPTPRPSLERLDAGAHQDGLLAQGGFVCLPGNSTLFPVATLDEPDRSELRTSYSGGAAPESNRLPKSLVVRCNFKLYHDHSVALGDAQREPRMASCRA